MNYIIKLCNKWGLLESDIDYIWFELRWCSSSCCSDTRNGLSTRQRR